MISEQFTKHKEKLYVKIGDKKWKYTWFLYIQKYVLVAECDAGKRWIRATKSSPDTREDHLHLCCIPLGYIYLVLKTSSDTDYVTSSDDLFQHLFQTIRNLMISLIYPYD